MNLSKSIILTILACFFPYMPILHATDDTGGVHCTGIHDHGERDGADHSMSSCIEIVKKIHKTTLSDFDFFEPIGVSIPFEGYYFRELHPKAELHNILFHATDPPLREPPNLIGTIRIIS